MTADDSDTDPTARLAEHWRRCERMYLGAPSNQFGGPSIELADGEATVSFDIEPGMHHAAGAAHGAFMFKVLDDAAFFAAQSVQPEFFVLTSGFTMNLLRPIATGRLTGRGRLVHRSSRVLLADAESFDEQGRLVSRGTGQFMVGRSALADLEGYR